MLRRSTHQSRRACAETILSFVPSARAVRKQPGARSTAMGAVASLHFVEVQVGERALL